MGSGVRRNEDKQVFLDEEGLKVIVMLCYFQKKVYISPIGLAGEKQIEEYRVQFSLGEDYLTALLPISGWSEYHKIVGPGLRLDQMTNSFSVPDDFFGSLWSDLDIGLTLRRKSG